VLTEQLVLHAWHCYDPLAEATQTLALADHVSVTFGRLLEDVTEAVLGRGYCALHRARLKAVHDAATFFCRVKSRNSVSATQSTPSPGGGAAAVCVPPVSVMQEMQRRLCTYLHSLRCTSPTAQAALDRMRRDDVLASLSGLHSPLLPLDITLHSLLLPLLEYLCCDMLMSRRLGDEVRRRLEADLAAIRDDEEGQADILQAVGRFWKLAVSGEKGRAGVVERLSGPVQRLVDWVRQHAPLLRMGNSLEELLGSVEPALRQALRAQEYESPEQFVQVFQTFRPLLGSLRVPPSSSACVATPGDRRECGMFELTLTQVLKDVSRERFVVEGVAVAPSEVREHLAAVLQARCEGMGRGGAGVEEAVHRILLAASRTVFGGDTFFLVRELFGGDGVVVAPAQNGGHDPIDIGVEQGGEAGLRVVVKTRNVYSIYSGLDLSGAAMVNLSASVTEVLPWEVQAEGPGLQEAAEGRVRTISIDAGVPPRL
jgi:hypothetical protein